MNIDPNYIMERPERYSKALVQEARDELKARRLRRQAEEEKKNPPPAPDELTILLVAARKCRSHNKLIELKCKIEAITGITYHID